MLKYSLIKVKFPSKCLDDSCSIMRKKEIKGNNYITYLLHINHKYFTM